MMNLDQFNALNEADAAALLYECCHCHNWALRVAGLRPFDSKEQLLRAADDVWRDADEAEILEAFKGHARIGDIELLRSRYAGRATAEQGQVIDASETTLQALYDLNMEYERRYGFIFIVCATGKSAEEMLMLLKARIDNGRVMELMNGAHEQGSITRLRLQQLIQ